MTPAQELRTAAETLRNLTRAPHLAQAIDLPYTEPLADLLEAAAQQEAYTLAEWGHRGGAGPHALAVARAINGSQP